ncbi:MAG: DNA repair protein RadA [bacterium]
MPTQAKKQKIQYVCQNCGFVSLRWQGRCGECMAWNTMIEERAAPKAARKSAKIAQELSKPVKLKDVDFTEDSRISFKSGELNRVLGGGVVPGSLILIGGDPGIGKSTLMLQEATKLANGEFNVLYISGEESNRQIKLRAQRLGLDSAFLYLLAETNLEEILAAIEKIKPGLIVVDSIQTIYQPAFESAPGTISQVRESALAFLTLAKTSSTPVILIGHVTKEGYLAGPKVLEHIVDTLLQFEGDAHQHFRILRALKNRFGSTREIGIFEMLDSGLRDVLNPSEIFLSQRDTQASGSAVICMIEGSRPILVEVQALATSTNFGMPQRTAAGYDTKRLSLILAVLEKRIGLRLGTYDVFLNAVGGVRLDEPAVDFGVASAIASSMRNAAIPENTVLIGEIGLGGEIRAVPHLDKRLNEAAKLGFARAFIPPLSGKKTPIPANFEIVPCKHLDEAFDKLF